MDAASPLDLFAERVQDHLPNTEAAIRDLLAQCVRDSEGMGLAEVEVEASSGAKRIDIVAHPLATGFEIKYHRPGPTGASRNMTKQYGDLLADARKLADKLDLNERYIVLITDRAGLTHVSNKPLLPTVWDRRREVTGARVRRQAPTAFKAATADGEWIDITTQMVWRDNKVGPDRMTGLAWRNEPIGS